MATTATCDVNAVEERTMTPEVLFYANDPEESHFFRGMLIAVSGGLVAWGGLLRIAGEMLHRLKH